MPSYEYRVFISHVWRTHTPYYDGLIRLLDKRGWFNYREMGVPKRRKVDGEAPMEQILEILRASDVIIVINTPVLGDSPNVLAELEEAERHCIPIIAVTPRGRRGGKHPILERARPVAWMGDSIVTAIREEVKKARRLKAATASTEVTPAQIDAFEPVEEAALEAKANLTPEALEEVRGADEIMVAPYQPTQTDLPKNVILKDEQAPSPVQVQSPRSWLSRLFVRH